MTAIEAGDTINITRSRSKTLVGNAVHRHAPLSKDGVSERLFTFAFSGLVYPQIWEDPVVDMAALALEPDQHVVAIASGGCNLLSYLTAAPIRLTGVDLNTAHIALNRLKQAGVHHLTYDEFYSMFGDAASKRNVQIFDQKLARRLDPETRRYWTSRGLGVRRRIEAFSSGFYHTGLLGRFIATGHTLARLLGGNPAKMVTARSLDEQKLIFEKEIRPLFQKYIVRKLLNRPASLFGLGIPPAQFEALSEGRAMHEVIEERLERLACGFDIRENYFAWQAFHRGYAPEGKGPLPPYLQCKNFDTLKDNIARARVLNISLTTHLESLAHESVDRFVLLDAQDWMTDDDLTALWDQITRTARPGARVIFRAAGTQTILPGRVPEAILSQWHYKARRSKDYTERDRSAIYGSFHLYIKGP